jgi:hypothetical protein
MIYPGPGKIGILIGGRQVAVINHSLRGIATLLKGAEEDIPLEEQVFVCSETQDTELFLDMSGLSKGTYRIRIRFLDQDGAEGQEEFERNVAWPGRPPEFHNARILNNLVWELMNVSSPLDNLGDGTRLSFVNPRRRWILFRFRFLCRDAASSHVQVFLESGQSERQLIWSATPGADVQEVMRFLPEGYHALTVSIQGNAELRRVVVRSIPALQYAFYGSEPAIRPFGPYDWDFLKEHVLDNVNTILGRPGKELSQWKQSGKKWLALTRVPKSLDLGDDSIQAAIEFWRSSPGYQDPLMDGVIVDEFDSGNDPVYSIYRRAVESLNIDALLKGKMFIPYVGKLWKDDLSRKLAQAALDGGGYIAWTRYLKEQRTEGLAKDQIKKLTQEMIQWEKNWQGITPKMVIVLGCLSTPNSFSNVDPSSDFRVYMDMQLNALANHPVFFGLGGVQEYYSRYTDEECIRWTAKLYRHYAIEGHMSHLCDLPYKLNHIENPDFEDGILSWSIDPAERGSVTHGSYRGYGCLQGRFPCSEQGDTFLKMRRSELRPNKFTQQIKNLVSGRLYSIKMITADHDDLVNKHSNPGSHAVTTEVEGAELLRDAKSSFQFTFPNHKAHAIKGFGPQQAFYMCYHWQVFRAHSDTATLIVSDWGSPSGPLGPVGQTLTYNFVEIQPLVLE